MQTPANPFASNEIMKLVIAGGTGFLGSPLAEVHAEEGHDVRVLTRGLTPGEARHEPGTGVPGITRLPAVRTAGVASIDSSNLSLTFARETDFVVAPSQT